MWLPTSTLIKAKTITLYLDGTTSGWDVRFNGRCVISPSELFFLSLDQVITLNSKVKTHLATRNDGHCHQLLVHSPVKVKDLHDLSVGLLLSDKA